MPDEPNSLPLEPAVAKAIDQTGQVPPMQIVLHPSVTKPQPVAPVVAPTHDIETDYHQQAQKDASVATAIWAPHAASIEDEQNLAAAQAFGWDAETNHKLQQLQTGVENVGKSMGEAVPQSVQEVEEHPIVSALKLVGGAMAGPGATVGGAALEGVAKEVFPNHPKLAGLVGSLIGGGLGGGKAAAESAIVDEAGNPMAKAAETLSPEALEAQTRGVQPQLEAYAKALKEHIANPNDEEFQAMTPGTMLNAEQTANLNIKINTRVDNLSKLAKAYMSAQGPEQQKIAMDMVKQELVPTAKLISTGVGVAAEHGRALAIHNTDWAAVKDMQAILANKSDRDWDSLVRALSTLESPGTRMMAAEGGQRELALAGELPSAGGLDREFAAKAMANRERLTQTLQDYLTAKAGDIPIALNNLERDLTESGQMKLGLGVPIESGQGLLNLTGKVMSKYPDFAKWSETPEARVAADRLYQQTKTGMSSRATLVHDMLQAYLTAGKGNPIALNNLQHDLSETGQMLLDLGEPVGSGQSLLNLTGKVMSKDPNFPTWAETPEARKAADAAYQTIRANQTAKAKLFLGQWLAGRPFYKALVNAQLLNPRIVGAKILTDVVYQPFNISMQSIGTAVRFRSLSAGAKLWTGAMIGSMRAIPDAWKFAKASIESGAPEFQRSIGQVVNPRVFAEDSGNTIPGAAANWMSSAFGIGARIILGTDQFAKTVAYRAELHTQAFYKGLEDAEKLGLSGVQAARYAETQSRAYIETFHPGVYAAAEENMARDTFTDEDRYTQAAKAVTEALPPLRMVATFTRTPINLLEQGMLASPFAIATHKFYRDVNEGGLARDTALTKLAMGTLFFCWMVHEASQGNITGSAPVDGKLRDQFTTNFGQENSLRIGDNMYSLQHLGAIGVPMIMAANYAQYSAQMNPQARAAFAWLLIHTFARTVSEAPLLEPTMHLMDAMGEGLNSWDDSGELSKGAQRAVGKFAGSEISSFIPAPLKIAADAYRGEHVELNDMWDSSKSRIPGFGLPAHRLQFGEPQYLPHGSGPDDVPPAWWMSVLNSLSPVTVDHAKNPDEVDKEQMRVGFVPSRVPRALYAKDPKYPITLSPEERDRWSVLAGSELKKADTIDGSEQLNQHDAIRKLINSGPYKAIAAEYPDKDLAHQHQAQEIRKVHDSYVEAARMQMIGLSNVATGQVIKTGESPSLQDKAYRRAKLEAPNTVVAN